MKRTRNTKKPVTHSTPINDPYFPQDVLAYIFNFFDNPRDLLPLACICKLWAKALEEKIWETRTKFFIQDHLANPEQEGLLRQDSEILVKILYPKSSQIRKLTFFQCQKTILQDHIRPALANILTAIQIRQKLAKKCKSTDSAIPATIRRFRSSFSDQRFNKKASAELLIENFLQKIPDPNTSIVEEPLIHWISLTGNCFALQKLIEQGAKCDQKVLIFILFYSYYLTPENFFEVICTLVKNGLDPTRGIHNKTPLNFINVACLEVSEEQKESLKNITNAYKFKILISGQSRNDSDCITNFDDVLAELNTLLKFFDSSEELIRILCLISASIHKKYLLEFDLLKWFICLGDVDAIKALLEKGANILSHGNESRNALDITDSYCPAEKKEKVKNILTQHLKNLHKISHEPKRQKLGL